MGIIRELLAAEIGYQIWAPECFRIFRHGLRAKAVNMVLNRAFSRRACDWLSTSSRVPRKRTQDPRERTQKPASFAIVKAWATTNVQRFAGALVSTSTCVFGVVGIGPPMHKSDLKLAMHNQCIFRLKQRLAGVAVSTGTTAEHSKTF